MGCYKPVKVGWTVCRIPGKPQSLKTPNPLRHSTLNIRYSIFPALLRFFGIKFKLLLISLLIGLLLDFFYW